jgi:hypothetical protein
MAETWTARLQRLATVRAIVLLVGIQLTIHVAILGWSAPAVQAEAGQPILDLRLGYSAQAAHEFLVAAGPEGRRRYWTYQALDCVFPLAYSLGCALLMAYLLARTFAPGSRAHRLVWVPFLIAAVDYLENGCVFVLLASFPEPAPTAARLAGSVSVVKHLLVLGNSCFAVVVLGLLTRRKLRGLPSPLEVETSD